MRSTEERGGFMIQALVLVVLLALVSSMLIRLSLGNYMLSHKTAARAAGRMTAADAETRVSACLNAFPLAAGSCAIPTAAQNCFPNSVQGRALTVASAGTPPDCSIRITLAEP